MDYIISYDIGTGGIKASLYDKNMTTKAKSFIEYTTYHPQPNYEEQSPLDWWYAFCQSTRLLINNSNIDSKDIKGIALSGASLVTVPFDQNGSMLCEKVPIWSDKRADVEAEEFFKEVDYDIWYSTTGNGFPAPCYPLFKLMWLKKHNPKLFNKISFVLGTKDYINYKLTGRIATDHSYASGTGAYNLLERRLEESFFESAGIPSSIFPPIYESHDCVGYVKEGLFDETGLLPTTSVFLGGVDNACTALGTVGVTSGKAYVSLGTSSWIPINTETPICDIKTRPYTFAHIEKNMFTSAYSIFSGGNSLRWMKEKMCPEICNYDNMTECAKRSPLGANGVMFHPGLAGGTSQDRSVYLRGGFFGLTLSANKNDLIRAVYEGVAFNLKQSLELLQTKCAVDSSIVFCGGGSKSNFWLDIFADVFNISAIRSNIDQDAATLGAAACAARGLGWFNDYKFIDKLHSISYIANPNPDNSKKYEELFKLFEKSAEFAADYGDTLREITKKEMDENDK